MTGAITTGDLHIAQLTINLADTSALERKLELIMATQAELAAKLNTLADRGEALTTKVGELIDAVHNGSQTTPEVDAAVARIDTILTTAEALVGAATPAP